MPEKELNKIYLYPAIKIITFNDWNKLDTKRNYVILGKNSYNYKIGFLTTKNNIGLLGIEKANEIERDIIFKKLENNN